MALSRTMLTIITRGFKRADKEHDDHIDTDEQKALAAEVYNELHSIVCGTGCRYFESEADITANGSANYVLPTGWLATVSVDRVLDSSGRRRPLRGPVPAQRQYRYAGQTGDACEYALAGGNIILLPTPSSGTYKHRYLPQPSDYATAADDAELDLVNSSGESFMYWSLACLGKDKSEADLRYAEARRQHFEEELRVWAIHQAATENVQGVVEHDDDCWPMPTWERP